MSLLKAGGFLVRICEPWIKVVMKLIKNVCTILAKIVLIPLGLAAAASAADRNS